jgi:hypothetical protein
VKPSSATDYSPTWDEIDAVIAKYSNVDLAKRVIELEHALKLGDKALVSSAIPQAASSESVPLEEILHSLYKMPHDPRLCLPPSQQDWNEALFAVSKAAAGKNIFVQSETVMKCEAGCPTCGAIPSASTSSSVPAGEKDWGRATVGLDGSHGFALLGADLQSGEAEFSPIENWPNASYKQERAAWGRALRALEDRLGSGPLRYEVIR